MALSVTWTFRYSMIITCMMIYDYEIEEMIKRWCICKGKRMKCYMWKSNACAQKWYEKSISKCYAYELKCKLKQRKQRSDTCDLIYVILMPYWNVHVTLNAILFSNSCHAIIHIRSILFTHIHAYSFSKHSYNSAYLYPSIKIHAILKENHGK